VSQNEHQPQERKSLLGIYKDVFIGGGVTGCVILLIVAVALVIGFWLDQKFESVNHIYIFGSILLSVPVTFVAILWVVGKLTARKKGSGIRDTAAQKQNRQEDADRGTNSEEA
jgi:H+/Cl- antiporter ClcA